MRLVWLLPLACFGCHAIDFGAEGKAQRLWQEGQAAMETGNADEAIARYHQSLAEDAKHIQNHLSLAAAYVEKGDDERACTHLGKFLEARPEHKNARFYYAELLLRRGCLPDAHVQFERVVAAAQEEPQPDRHHLVHCHTRLVEIAEGLEDDYHYHLHRGIGMYLLSQARPALEEVDGKLSAQALLFKAARDLAQARNLRPREARPSWYLYGIWRQLGQQHLARACLRAAERAAAYSDLTPVEQAHLQLAIRAFGVTGPAVPAS